MKKEIEFYKYQGTGNDFVIVDNRCLSFPKHREELIEKICDRRFGVGADGLILLENDDTADFRMIYFNSNGREGTMCGNGGRCIASFANFLGVSLQSMEFISIDGMHRAEVLGGVVKLKMRNVQNIPQKSNDIELDTGSLHFVRFVEYVENYDVYRKGKNIRYSDLYKAQGINVNFVSELEKGYIFVRTYERGVEDETYSCGTGVTACSLVYANKNNLEEITVKTLGGELKVYAKKKGDGYEDIWLHGAVQQEFRGYFPL